MKTHNSNNSRLFRVFKRELSFLTPILSFAGTLVFYFSILFFIIAFGFRDSMTGNWYQQFLPNLNGRQIQDITFLDSLTGYSAARQTGDTSYILKTTNGGDNWSIVYRNFFAMTQIQFLNANTGYAVGAYLFKTINGGFNWNQVSAPAISPEELYVLNEDTIWIISSDGFSGGVFRTTNGGINWTQQFSGGNQNPNKIYMFNARIGFMANSSALPNTYKTTNSGVNWTLNLSGENFTDIHFIDSLLGWKSNSIEGSSMKKTTNGGINWVNQILPYGGIILTSNIYRFSNLSRDTIWGAGGQLFYGGGRFRSMLFRTTNGGDNWLFQIPDTSFGIPALGYMQFISKYTGWSYNTMDGIHTTNGGDTTFYTPVNQTSSEVPIEHKLFQNYPNPFNPKTVISYQLVVNSHVQIKVFDIQGKEMITLVNQKQSASGGAGTYEVEWNASGYSSGIYFYSLFADGKLVDTKKMILIK